MSQPVSALLAALMLRGPLTPGELRTACDRMYRFADISSVEAYLEEMAARAAGTLAVKLPKQAGSREHRWAHLLGGPIEADAAAVAAGTDDSVTTGELATLKSNIAQLRDDVAELRALVERLYQDLGVKR